MTGLYVASNPTSLSAQFNLVRNMSGLSDTLERLSTGLRINSGKDDPAGLIASEVLKSEITATSKAITNTQRAISMISTADSALSQIGSLLNDIKGLVVEGAQSATMNAEMIAANQMQIDASIAAIDQIAKRTTYNGQKILDGSMDFRTVSTADTRDPNDIGISNLKITNANFGTQSQVDVSVNVLETAKKGTLIYYGSGVTNKTTIDVTGSLGTQSFTFAGRTNEEIAAEVNRSADSTGVTARVEGQASRGTIVLSSVGANNDIVITANDAGFAAGDYTFEIVEGEENDAYIVSPPNAERPGLVRITVQKSYSREYTNFIDMFNINIDTDGPNANTSVSIRQGDKNSAVLNHEAKNATGVTKDGIKTIQLTNAGDGGHISNANGWTFVMVDSTDERAGTFDDTGKYAYVEIGATQADTQANLENAVGRLTGSTVPAGTTGQPTVTIGSGGGGGLVVGDTFTLDGGADAGELVVTYKEGATAGDILKLLNANSGVSATLLSGVDPNQLIKNLPKVPTRLDSTNARLSTLSSSVTAAEVVELFNAELGDMFTAVIKSGDTGTGRVTFSDASVAYGDLNLDNVIRFAGMDNGPIVRLTTTDVNGIGVQNQQLGFVLRNPTEKEIASGIHTKILEIKLATDSNGNSITTAQDIVDLLNSATAAQTGGISASLILPAGVDPNNRRWVTDICGNVTLLEDCEGTYGTGIVQPTGSPGTCEMQENDLVLLGNNQQIISTNATAYIKNSAPTTLTLANTAAAGKSNSFAGSAGQTVQFVTDAGDTGWNGITFNFSYSTAPGVGATTATWNATTGQVDVVIGKLTGATGNLHTWNQVLAVINGAQSAIEAGAGLAAGSLDDLSILQTDGTAASTGTAIDRNTGVPSGPITISGAVAVGDALNGQKTQGQGRAVDSDGEEHVFTTVEGDLANAMTAANALYTSALNGVTIVFDNSITAANSTWDAKTGTLTVGISGGLTADTDDEMALADLISIATAKHGAAIKSFNGTALELQDFLDGKVTLIDSNKATGGTGNDTYSAAEIAALNGLRFTVGGGLGEGDVIETRAETGKVTFGTSGKQVSIVTDKATSALNGVSFNFTAEANLAGFNTETGALTVYLNPETQALTDPALFEQAVQDAINASINMNWEQIRRYNDYSFSDPVTVSIDLYDEEYDADPNTTGIEGSWVTATDLFSAYTTDTSLGFPPSRSTDTTNGAVRGMSVSDPALLIRANLLGQEEAGIKIVFEQDDSLQASTTERAYVEVSYDQRSDGERVLTIRANATALQNGTDGGINAALLAAALNEDATFLANFTAIAPIWNNDAASGQTHGVIHFGSGTQFATAETVGGWDISTNKNAIGLNQATSNGITMFNNNDSNERLVFEAVDYGSKNFVQVSVISGDFKTYCPQGSELNYLAGTDVVATINGMAAKGDGTNISIDTANLAMSMNVTNKIGYTSFAINGGGAVFQLGPNVVSSQQLRLGIGSMLSTRLGGASGSLYQLKSDGDADITKDAQSRVLADAIINETIKYVAVVRGRLGSIQRSMLEPNVSMLQDTLTALTEAEAQISNADFAVESSNLTKYQLLVQSGMQTLGIANTFTQYAAQLLQ